MASLWARLIRDAGAPAGWTEPDSFDESFRVLASNVESAVVERDLPGVVVTSSHPGEGKTTVCAKLAATFAARGRRVVAVDLDARAPGLHTMLGGHNRFGATEVLRGRRKLSDSLQYATLPTREGLDERGLILLAAGTSVVDPDDLLSQPRAHQLIERLAGQADILLIDSPPVLSVADTLVTAGLTGASLLVVDTHQTNAADLSRSRDLLVRNGGEVVGVVLNQVRAGDAGVSASTGYGYGSTPSPTRTSPPDPEPSGEPASP